MAAALWALACGGDAPPTSPVVTPPVAAAASPTPAPTPTPAPEVTPDPCQPPTCEPPVSNRNPAVRLTLRLYTVTDLSGTWLQDWNPDDEIPVGYRATIDATAKDKEKKDTLGEDGEVEFFFSNSSIAKIGGGHPFQRRITPQKPGELDCWGVIDGVRSNTLTLKFRR